MALPKWAEWGLAALGLLSVGLAVLAAAMVPLDPYRWILVVVGVLLIALSAAIPLVVGIILPMRDRRRRRKAERAEQDARQREQTEQAERKAAEEQEKAEARERLRLLIAAWRKFTAATGDLRFDHLSGEYGQKRPEPITNDEWNDWRKALARTRQLSGEIEASHRPKALYFLNLLSSLERDGMQAGYFPFRAFSEWLIDREKEYSTAARREKLPPS